jgi:hypothetical protein
MLFATLNPGFDPVNDYVSKLGAKGQPYAFWRNLLGFGTVGALILAFGATYGAHLGDRLVGVLLALFGIGFAATSVPVDIADPGSSLSKAHTVAICLGLACFMGALARLAHARSNGQATRRSANAAATLLGVAGFGYLAQLWSMPVAHRLVFGVVFGWMALTAAGLLRSDPQASVG